MPQWCPESVPWSPSIERIAMGLAVPTNTGRCVLAVSNRAAMFNPVRYFVLALCLLGGVSDGVAAGVVVVVGHQQLVAGLESQRPEHAVDAGRGVADEPASADAGVG